MLQTYDNASTLLQEEQSQPFDLTAIFGILRRRILYFAVPFLLVLMLGSAIVAIQRPIYRAEGKILVQSPEIPPDLVRPTITEVADERIQVIEQRLLARDNLLSIVSKYNLFPHERTTMSGTQLLDLMRDRIAIQPVALDSQYISHPNNPAIAFTLSFDYEVPELAMRVANDFLTAILSEDATTRTNNATDTANFLADEVKRLQGEQDAIVAQIEALKQRPPDLEVASSDELATKMSALAKLEAELSEKSAIYSAEYPEIRNLRRQIAALKRDIASTPGPKAALKKNDNSDAALAVLQQRRIALQSDLNDANRKLLTARMGESLEQGEQGERLQVIEQPTLPQIPVRPKRMKWLAAAFVGASVIGAGCVLLAEMLDTTIRGQRELGTIVDRGLLVSIPYIATPGEERRRRAKLIFFCLALVAALAAGIAYVMSKGITFDFFTLNSTWIDPLRRILH